MMKGKYAVGDSPHIHAPDSAVAMTWTMVAALLPLVLLSVIQFRFEAVWIFLAALGGGVLAEFLAKGVLAKPTALSDGTTVVAALLLALLSPAGVSPWTLLIVVMVAIFVTKEFFGGVGQYPFHPALVGVALLVGVTGSVVPGNLLGPWSFAVAALGGLFLISRGIIRWEVPLIYLVVFSGVAWIFRGADRTLLSGSLWVLAFYLVTDPTTTPLTRRGVAVAASLSALLGAFFIHGAGQPAQPAGAILAILLMSALGPWLDRALR